MPPVAILIALADTTRCRIIEILRDGPQPVHVLTASFAISRPAISRHLRVLKAAGLISEKKQGRENRYALHPARLAPVGRWLTDLQPSTAPTISPVLQESIAAKPRKPAPLSQMGFDF
jgi:DNA-binding transcriptional ArsR family regulator